MHPADIADIAHELSPEERAAVLDALEDEVAADAVEEMHPSFQAALIGDLPDSKAAELLSNMSPDDAADLLADLPEERRPTLLALMEKDDREDIVELLTYPERSAGGIMTTDFVHVAPDITAAQAIERLREQEPEAETVYYIYVIDRGEHLLGVVSLRDVLVAPPQKRVRGRPCGGAHRRRPGRGHPPHRQIQPARPAGRRRPERAARHRHRRRRHRSRSSISLEEAAPAHLPLR